METGGYDATFVEDPADYLKCVICHLVLKRPVLFVNCGHRVCKSCFGQMKQHATQRNVELLCPHDRTKINPKKVVEDKGISRVVLDLKVRCTNVGQGCGWTGELRDLQQHLDVNCGPAKKNNEMEELLLHLVQRVNEWEEKMLEKDKEIVELRESLSQSNSQVETLRRQVETLERVVKTNKADCMANDINQNKIIDKIEIECQNVENVVTKNIQKYISSAADEIRDKDTAMINMRELALMNVSEYIPRVKTVFEWALEMNEDGNSLPLTGLDYFSQNFYASSSGPYCVLSATWFKKKTDFHLGVFLHTCKSPNKNISADGFDVAIRLQALGYHWLEKTVDLDRDLVRQNIGDFQLDDENDKSRGFGELDFLRLTDLKHYLENGVLTIRCTLYHYV